MSSEQTNPTYMIYSNNAYRDVTNSIMPLKRWCTIDDLTTLIGQSYTPNGITDDLIKSHLCINYSGGNSSQKYISRNLENGTVKLWVRNITQFCFMTRILLVHLH